MTKKSIYFAFILCFSAILVSCSDSSPKNQDKQTEETAVEPNSGELAETKAKVQRIRQIFYTLPSPMELSLMFKKEGIEYRLDKLHDPKLMDSYLLNYKKALNLGVYGADLSYAGLFSRYEDAILYFKASKLMAEELGVGEVFQSEFIGRIDRNPSNRDTLLQVISDFFLENDNYLREQDQGDLSTYILVGGWIEGMNLGLQMISEKTDSSGIKTIIAGQESSLDNILVLMRDLEKPNELSKAIGEGLIQLRKEYKEIRYSKTTSKEKVMNNNGELVLNTGSGKVEIEAELLAKITEDIQAVRKLIIE